MEQVFKVGVRVPNDKNTQVYHVTASTYEDAITQVKESIPDVKVILCQVTPIGAL